MRDLDLCGSVKVMLLYCAALAFYLWVRIAKTLDLGKFLAYGVIVLVVEVMGAATTLLYGLNLLFHPINDPLPEDPLHPGLTKVHPPCLTLPSACSHACSQEVAACSTYVSAVATACF